MKLPRNPHPDYVRDRLARWRLRLTRALAQVARLEKALDRVEKKRALAQRTEETLARRGRKARQQARESVQ